MSMSSPEKLLIRMERRAVLYETAEELVKRTDLPPWPRKFVDSIWATFQRGGDITPKQADLLELIYSETCGV